MKKKVLRSMALLSAAVVAGSTPLIAQGAEIKAFQIPSNPCYQVYVGQGTESLTQFINGICNSLGNNVPDQETLSYAEQVVKLVNEERAKEGLPALAMDADITAAANVRAKEIMQKFSHTRPNGSSFSSVLKEQGVSFRGSGENIAWGQKSPEQVMNGWMNSDGHRANILNPNYKNIGVGYYQDENGVNYWVQLFTF